MTAFIDYQTILNDLQAALTTAQGSWAVKFSKLGVNQDDRDFVTMNMPLLDLRVRDDAPEPVTNTTYYTDAILECEIVVHSLASRQEAARIRDNLLDLVRRYVKDHPRFSGAVETTVIGRATFGTNEPKSEGVFIAGVVFELHPRLYTE